jgi:hypothetical protein
MVYDVAFLDHCPACEERGTLIVVKATVVPSEEVIHPMAPLLPAGWTSAETTVEEEVQCSKCYRFFTLNEVRVENSSSLIPKQDGKAA